MEGAGGSGRLKGSGDRRWGMGSWGRRNYSSLISCILYVIYGLIHICPIGQRNHKNRSGILKDEFQILLQN